MYSGYGHQLSRLVFRVWPSAKSAFIQGKVMVQSFHDGVIMTFPRYPWLPPPLEFLSFFTHAAAGCGGGLRRQSRLTKHRSKSCNDSIHLFPLSRCYLVSVSRAESGNCDFHIGMLLFVSAFQQKRRCFEQIEVRKKATKWFQTTAAAIAAAVAAAAASAAALATAARSTQFIKD